MMHMHMHHSVMDGLKCRLKAGTITKDMEKDKERTKGIKQSQQEAYKSKYESA